MKRIYSLKATRTKVFASNFIIFALIMKRLLLFISIIFALCIVFSCDKEEITTPDQFPEWLQNKMTELFPDQRFCEITDVTIIRYNGKTYYHIYCGIWSCMYCQFFDEHGNRPTWDEKVWNDFGAHQKVIKKIPACQN
jgi:hypothetical protein